MRVIAAYGVQYLVADCRGSGAGKQGVRPERGMLHDCSRAASLIQGRIACCPAPDP